MHTRHFAVLALAFSLGACATAAGGAAGAGTTATASPNRITADEIAKADVATAYDAVYQLHRPWFHDMSAGASGDVFVYVDNREMSDGVTALRQIPAHDVANIDYLRSADAVLRYGKRASGGAIIVTRK